MVISKKIKAISAGSITTVLAVGALGAFSSPTTSSQKIQLTSANVALAHKGPRGGHKGPNAKKRPVYTYTSPTVTSTQAITDGLTALHVTNPTNLSIHLSGNKQHVPMYHVSVKPSSPGAVHMAVVNGKTGATKVITPHHKVKNTYTTPKLTAMQAVTDAEGALHVTNPANLRLNLVGNKQHVPMYRVSIKASTTTKPKVVAVNGLTGSTKIMPMPHPHKGAKNLHKGAKKVG